MRIGEFRVGDVVHGERSDDYSLTFGPFDTGYHLREGSFTIEYEGPNVNDDDNPFGDGVVFGPETEGAVRYTWTLMIVRETPEEAWEAAQELRRVWRGYEARKHPSRYVKLQWRYGSVGDVVTYGRPRNFAVDRSRLRDGIAIVTCDFQAKNDLVYAATMNSVRMNIVPNTTGGITAPLKAPLSASGIGAASRSYIQNTGKVDSPVEIVFNGPVTDPYVQLVNGWRVGLDMTIQSDQSVVVNAFENTVMSRGGSYAGKLTRETPKITDLVLPRMNSYELAFGGVDHTGLATVDVKWADAYYAI